MTVCWYTLFCLCSTFWPLKSWLWSHTHLTCASSQSGSFWIRLHNLFLGSARYFGAFCFLLESGRKIICCSICIVMVKFLRTLWRHTGNKGITPLITPLMHNLDKSWGLNHLLLDPSTLLPGKEPQHLLNMRLGGPQHQSEHIKEEEKLHPCWDTLHNMCTQCASSVPMHLSVCL
jgi:hypothetical protein